MPTDYSGDFLLQSNFKTCCLESLSSVYESTICFLWLDNLLHRDLSGQFQVTDRYTDKYVAFDRYANIAIALLIISCTTRYLFYEDKYMNSIRSFLDVLNTSLLETIAFHIFYGLDIF